MNINGPSALNAIGTATSAPSATTSLAGQLNESDFLTLLAAELKYQDPLHPVSNTQFIAELAQFSTLAATTKEEATLSKILQAVSGGNPILAASTLIGKSVTTADIASPTAVTAVTASSQGIELTLQGGKTVALSAVTGVSS